jgi:signal peptidase
VAIALNGQRQFYVQGDANNAPDPRPVIAEQIRGVRWYSVPYLAYPSLLVGGNIRRIFVMGAVALLIGYSIASFVGAIRDRRRSRRDRAVPVPATDREPVEVAS